MADGEHVKGRVFDTVAARSAWVFDELDESIAVARRTRDSLAPHISLMLDLWIACVKGGGKILFFGNGGSASQAQHFAAELVVRIRANRKALPAIALTTDTAILTAAGNDFGFERIFARQVEAIGAPGDLAVALSTSGRSANVVSALIAARTLGLATAALSGGDGGDVKHVSDQCLVVPSGTTARVQEMHLAIGHILCCGLERALIEPVTSKFASALD